VREGLPGSALLAVMRASQAVASSLDLEQILHRIVEQAALISSAPVVRLFLLDEREQQLEFRVAVGVPADAEADLRVAVGRGFTGQVAATRRPVMVADTGGDPRVVFPAHRERHGLVSYLGLPVLMGSRLLGVLVFNSHRPQRYSEDEVSVLEVFAQQAAIALEHAQLHAAVSRRAEQLATLNRLTRSLMASEDAEAVGRAIMEAARTLVPGSAVRLWDAPEPGDALMLVASTGLREPRGGKLRLDTGEGLAGLAAAARRPVYSPDVTRDPRYVNREWATAEGLVSALVIPLLSGDRLRGMLATFTREHHEFDQTERDLLEALSAHAAIALETVRHARALEGRVRARTAELEAANRDLEAFAYTVSHDLRAPLRGLANLVQMLVTDHLAELSPRARDYLGLMQERVRRMGQLIDDLLAFSRSARQPLARQRLAPAAIARRAFEDLRGEGRQVDFVLEELPDCLADPALLHQVFVNLLGNALKFTRTRERARVEVRACAGGGQPVYLVRDNGVGFDPRQADRLFGVFRRAHTAQEYEGWGVGLAIAQRIVERHGGRIWAQGEVGRGATFFFTLGAGPV